MRKILVGLSLVLSILLITACSNQAAAKPKHLNDVVSYFKEKGFTVGEKSEKAYQMIGAIDGFAITINDQQVELYEFGPKQSNATLDQAKETGKFANSTAVVNGNFMMVDYKNNAEVDKAFKEFK